MKTIIFYLLIGFIPIALYAIWENTKARKADSRRNDLFKNGLTIIGKIIDFRQEDILYRNVVIKRAVAEATYRGIKREFISEKLPPEKTKHLAIGQNVTIKIDRLDPDIYYFNPT